MTKGLLTLMAVAIVVSGSGTAAHHPLREYNDDLVRRLEGTLAGFELRNPHSRIRLDVRNRSGQTEQWMVEWSGAMTLKRQGVGSRTLAPGDHLVVTGHPAWNGESRRLWLRTITRPADQWAWRGRF
jgi:hypothetical protein